MTATEVAALHAHASGRPVPAPTASARSLDAYPLAKCLDGSSARYYLRAGTNPSRWLIFHEGGGFCTSIADCRQRAKTRLGSTARDEASMALDRFYFSQVRLVGSPRSRP